MRIVPAARSRRWLWWTGAWGLFLTLLLWLNRYMVLGQRFDAVIALRLALAAFALSGLIHVLGWLGARLAWLLSVLGLLSGLALLFVYASRDATGWEDLTSFLAFVECVVGGFGLGLLAEGIGFIVRRLRRQ